MATVLVVEDEFAVAELRGMALADEGYRVLTAADGCQEAGTRSHLQRLHTIKVSRHIVRTKA